MRNIKSPYPKYDSDVEMCDLDRAVEMEWMQSVIMTPEQLLRLISMKEKAIRIQKARHQKRVFKEELAKKQ